MDSRSSSIPEGTTFHLFGYYRSSCSARLRIALALKNIPVQTTYINLITNEQQDASYSQVNPSMSVPTLHITSKENTQVIKLTQSIAALEYLDEAFPSTFPLLPSLSDPSCRATVRTLVSIIACDVQPPTNLRILIRARALASAGGLDPVITAQQWAKEIMTNGLLAYEKVCKDVAGRFSVGDEITIADCCLVPAVWGAERYGVDFSGMQTIQRVYEEMSKLEVVKEAHWKNQRDTPAELRT